jgi:hypothetical protein
MAATRHYERIMSADSHLIQSSVKPCRLRAGISGWSLKQVQDLLQRQEIDINICFLNSCYCILSP